MKYRLHRYFYSSRPIIPLIVIICLFAAMYSMKPGDVCSGYIISGWFQFILMSFVALSINGNEEAVDEQLMLFRAKGWLSYCMARELNLLVLSCIYGIILTVEPVIVNLFNDFSFFTRALTAADVVLGAVIILGSGLAGIIIGDILHPRIIGNRKIAIAFTAFMMLLSMVKEAIIDDYRFLAVLGYLLPPVMKPARDLGKGDYFDISSVCFFFIMMSVYYIVVVIIKNIVLKRKKFA